METFSLDELRTRLDLDRVGPERLRFHLILVGLDGEGLHEVDFSPVPVRPGTLVHVLPGQVHRWVRPSCFEAQLLLLPDDADLRPPGPVADVRRWQVTQVEWQRTAAVLPLIAEVMGRGPEEHRNRELTALRDLLVLRLGLDRALPGERPEGAGPLPAPYLAFRAELDAHPAAVRSVTRMAAALGYSPRTLTRACLAATGRSAKELLDERVYLEARRMLVHTERPVASIAAALGFSEPTNFTKFFVRMSGGTPGRWREGLA